jgi:hypothetical protein
MRSVLFWAVTQRVVVRICYYSLSNDPEERSISSTSRRKREMTNRLCVFGSLRTGSNKYIRLQLMNRNEFNEFSSFHISV